MFLRLLVSQVRYRWGVTALVFLALTSLVSLYVYLKNTNRYMNRSMQLIAKNLGHNMLILPESANPLSVYLCDGDQTLFDDTVTSRLASRPDLASRYYVSLLQKRIELGGRELILSGIQPVPRADESREKGNLIKPLKPGTARLGIEAAAALGKNQDDSLELMGATFRVAEVMAPQGTDADFRVYIPLRECQRLLGQPGKINAIMAFECLEFGDSLQATEEYQQRKLAEVMPGFRHISKTTIAQGRYLARATTSASLRYLLALVSAVTILVIAIAGVQEVAERRSEVGIFAAIGTGAGYIAALYAIKMLILALAASMAGFLIGSQLAVSLTGSFLVVETRQVAIVWRDLAPTIELACAVSLVAMAAPMAALLRLDPKAILTEE